MEARDGPYERTDGDWTQAQADLSELSRCTSRSSDLFDKRRCRSATSSVLFQRSRAADSISSGLAPSATSRDSTLWMRYSPQFEQWYRNTGATEPSGVEWPTCAAPRRPQRKHPAFGTGAGVAGIRYKTSRGEIIAIFEPAWLLSKVSAGSVKGT